MEKQSPNPLRFVPAACLIFCLGMYCGRNLSAPITVTNHREMSGISREITEKININTASAQELSSLPGVSSADVKHILLFRAQNGPFLHEKDLLRVTGFTEEKYRSLSDLVTVGGKK